MRLRSTPALVAPLLLLIAMLAGCATTSGSVPLVAGSSGGGTRTVSLGDELVIRIPGSAQAVAPSWRVSSFDSLMLRRTQTSRRGTGSDGRPEWTARFVARTPGNCEITLTRTLLGPDGEGEIGERRRYPIRIRNR